MEKLEHPFWIVEAVNAVLGPIVAAALAPFGFHLQGPDVIPNYIVMTMLIVAGITVMCLLVRSRLSVEHPSRFQILLEDGVVMMNGMIEEWIGPGSGARYLPLISALCPFTLGGNFPGLSARVTETSS